MIKTIMMAAIDVSNFTKRYGDTNVADGLSFTVEESEVFGFLGPNGAGKSTTINCLLDFSRPTSGQLSVLGMNARTNSKTIRQRTGVLPEGYEPYPRLTGRQHIEFAMESKDVDSEPAPILERVGIADAADRKASGYSKGMAKRLGLGMALVGEPELLILDEPTSGLDPNGARELRQIVKEEHARGATVFFSSHVMEQVESVCDRVGILRDGTMVAIDTVAGLREKADTPLLHVTVDRLDESVVDSLESVPDVVAADARVREGVPTITVETDGSKTAVLSTIEDSRVSVEDFSTERASLEDVFHAYTTETEVIA